MKREYILYYFDKSFKGKVDGELFGDAKSHLFNLVIGSKDLDVDNAQLRCFTKKYYEIHDIVEKELERIENIINSESFKGLSLINKLKSKNQLKFVRGVYQNAGKFSSSFFDAFGVSLGEVKDEINREEKSVNM